MERRVEWLIDEIANSDPERLALIHGPRCWTYGQLRAECDRRAGVLIEAGLAADDFIVTAAPVSDDLIIAFLACCRAGGVFVTLSPLLTAPELRELSAQVRPALGLTVTGDPNPALGAPRTLPLALPGDPAIEACVTAERRSLGGDPLASVAIRGTSSTTGVRAKLVVRNHAQLTWLREPYLPWEVPGSVNCCYTPNQFMSGEVSRVFALGGTLHLPAGTTPRGVEEEFVRHGVTVVYSVPALLRTLVAQPVPPPNGLQLTMIRITGAALSPDLQRAAAERYGTAVVAEYGATEARAIMGAVGGMTPPGSIGIPFPGTEVRLLDEDGQLIPTDAVNVSGELIVRSPNVMLGYHGDAAATAAVLRDGWLHTGDLAQRDAAGFYYLVGRRSERLNVGGFKFAPEEVEAVLAQHPSVREAVVVARPDAARGEVACAIIVPVDHPPPDVEELRRFCRERLANPKVPRRFEFRDSLPHSPLGKVLRTQL
ncbi:MAG TPA: AMP-binding protein [Thermomicrobiales bacterium]|jgi:acyl-CoA synthetase (AMP-forming)/AMP-acid ligase II